MNCVKSSLHQEFILMHSSTPKETNRVSLPFQKKKKIEYSSTHHASEYSKYLQSENIII